MAPQPGTKLSPSQFAQKIKSKYPQYSDIPDDELAQKMLTKYPEYGDMVDMGLVDGQQPPVDEQAVYEARKQAMRSALGPLGVAYDIPVVGDMLHAGATQVATGFGDVIPQTAAQSYEVLRSASDKTKPMNEEDYINSPDGGVAWRRFLLSKGIKEAQDLHNNPELNKELFAKYGKEFFSANPQATVQIAENFKNITARRQDIEQYVQQQKDESADKMLGIPQSYENLKSPTDVAKYVGNMGFQGLWQLPLTIVTRGASSAIMEMAEVYDQQLDALAEKHGISRQEVIARGLDKPAEGQLYAAAAAALDATSAGNILKVAKSGGAKLLKYLIGAGTEALTESAQGSLEETGGAVGANNSALEAFKNAWTTHFSRRLNEAIGGAIGATAMESILPGGDSEVKAAGKAAAKAAADAQATVDETSTGDESLDIAIDKAAEQDSRYIDKILSENPLEGGTSKLEEEHSKLEEEHQKALDELEEFRRVERQRESAPEMANVLAGRSLVPNQTWLGNPTEQNRVTEEHQNEWYGDEVSVEDAIKMNPYPVKYTTTPVLHNGQPVMAANGQPLHDFEFTDEAGGKATGTVAGNVAALKTVYAAPEERTTPAEAYRGRGFYKKVINKLKENGVTEVVIPEQSEGTVKSLQKLVKNKQLFNGRDFVGKDNTIPTRFDLVKPTKQPKSNDRKIGQRIRPQKSENGTKPIQEGNIEGGGTKKRTPSRILQTPRQKGKGPQVISEPKVPKPKVVVKNAPAKKVNEEHVKLKQQKTAERMAAALERQKQKAIEDSQKEYETIEKRLENALKRKPGVRMGLLEKLHERAEKGKFTKLQNVIREHIDALQAEKDIKEEKAENKITKAEKRAAEGPKKEEAPKKETKKISFKPNTLFKTGAENANLEKVKEAYYTAIAEQSSEYQKEAHTTAHTKRAQELAEEYIAMRKEAGLTTKDMTVEKVISKAKSYVPNVNKVKTKEKQELQRAKAREIAEKAGKDAKLKLSLLELEKKEIVERINKLPIPKQTGLANLTKEQLVDRYLELKNQFEAAQEAKRIQQERLNAAAKDILEALGENPEDIEGVSFGQKTVHLHEQLLDMLNTGRKALLKSIKQKKFIKISATDLAKVWGRTATRKSIYSPVILQKLVIHLEKRLRQQGKELNIYLYTGPNVNFGGMYAYGKNKDVLVLPVNIVGKLSKGYHTNTLGHELFHGITGVLSQVATHNDERFSREIIQAYTHTGNYLLATIDRYLQRVANVLGVVSENPIKLDNNYDSSVDWRVLLAIKNAVYNTGPYKNVVNAINLLGDISDKKDQLTDEEKKEAIFTARAAFQAALRDIYGLSDHHEFVSESVSERGFIHLLSLVPSQNITRQRKEAVNIKHSILYQVYTHIKDYISRLTGIEYGKSVLDDLMHTLAYYDQVIDDAENVRDIADPEWHIESMAQRSFFGANIEIIPNMYAKMYAQDLAEMGKKIRRGTHLDKIVGKLSKKEAPKKPNTTNTRIIQKIASTLYKRKEVKSLDDVRKYMERVNKNRGQAVALGDYFSIEVWHKIQKDRQKKEEGKKAQKALVAKAKLNPQYKESVKYKDDVDTFERVDLEELSAEEIGKYGRGLLALAEGGNPSKEAYNIVINKVMVKEKLKTLLPIAKDVQKKLSQSLVKWTNAGTLVSILAKYKGDIANKLMSAVHAGLMQARTRATLQAKYFYEHISQLATNGKLTLPSLVKMGMVGRILATKAHPMDSVAWAQEVLENAIFVEEAAKNKLAAKKNDRYQGDLNTQSIEKELEIASAIKNQIQDVLKLEGGYDEAVARLFTKEERAVYDAIRQFVDSHESDFERNAKGMWDTRNYEHLHNYFPSRAQGKDDTSVDFAKDELLQSNAENLWDAVNGLDENDQNENIAGKKAGAQFRRLSPKGYFYEWNALAIAQRHAKSTLYDMYATMEIKALNRLLKSSEFRTAFGPNIKDAFFRQLHSIVGATKKVDDVSGLPRLIMKFRDAMYTTALATSGQIVLQSSSGFAAAAVLSAHINPAKFGKIFKKSITASFQSTFDSIGKYSKVKKFMEDNGLGIQMRDILFEKYLTPEDFKNQMLKKTKLTADNFQNATEWALRQGDKLGARLVWWAAYFNAGGTIDNPSKEAIVQAERMVAVLQNMSDAAYAPEMFKYDTASKKILFSMFYAFKAFSLNSWLNLLYSTRYSLNNKEAAQVAAAQFGSVVAYHAMAVMAVRPLYGVITEALTGGGDDDDDKEKPGKLDQIIAESIWDIIIGMAAPSMIDQGAKYFVNKTILSKEYAPMYGEFNQYENSPLPGPPDLESVYKNMLGPGWRDAAELFYGGIDLAAQQAVADDFFEDAEKEEKRQGELEDWLFKFAGTAFAAYPGAPFRGDIKRIGDAWLRKRKKERNTRYGGGTSGGSEDYDMMEQDNTGEEPVFEEKDYDINLNDIEVP